MFKKISEFFTFNNTLLLLAFLLFFIMLRWNGINAPFERDEGVYAYSAWVTRQGMQPYEYSFPYKPPMIIYTYLVGQLIFGDVVWGPRVLALLFSLATILLTALITRKKFGINAAWISAWLLSLMLVLPVNFGGGMLADVYYAANTEIFMLFPLMALVYISISDKKGNNRNWFLSGVFAATALSYKPISLGIIIFVYLYWLVALWKKNKNVKNVFINLFLALAGGVVALLVIFLPFVVQDKGQAVWDQLVGFSSCYAGNSGWDYSPGQLVNRILIMGKYYWSAYLLLIYLLFKRPKGGIFFVTLLAISFVTVYQSLIGHYFLQMMPFFAIVTAVAIVKLSKEKTFGEFNILFVTTLVLLTILWPIRSIFSKSPQQLGLWVYGNLDPVIEAQFVGEKVKSLTEPGDFVFVEGMDPQILYFSGRKHSVKMEWTNFLASSCSALFSYNKEYVEDLYLNKPQVIVLCVSGSCASVWEDEKIRPFLRDLRKTIAADYRVVGGWVPTAKGGYWLEPITKEEIKYSRLVVFVRK